ncbi:tyramine receptor Ser-2 [Thalassophryne amazonica]|uniref:tyramine receptor Ser-2 n=1 Tax=Thalassophryne amazonica TaxID=390379 RepID=UPI001471D57F|nr:tyramine receptor Ser-2 [Thalassophryne amazonica]
MIDTEKLIESIIRAVMFVAGILGNNWLALRSLPVNTSGLRTNEVLFLNLAFSNLITNYLVDLPDTMADFAGRWFMGETFCGVFRFCADLSETSSIFTTLFISAFWYQKLVGSLKRGGAPVQLDNLVLVGCLLVGSWTVAVVFSIPHFFFVTVEGANDSHKDCIDVFPNALARQTYEILYLTLANALPVAGIVYASFQIVITLLKNQRCIRGHNSNPTKEMFKDSKSLEKIKEEKPNTSKEINESSNIYIGVTAASSLHVSQSSQVKSKTNRDTSAADPPNNSKTSQMPAKSNLNSSSQVRAAKSVVAVASVFLVCWLTHLLLRITRNIHTSSLVVEVESYIAASYTCIIPYIFLHGVKKLSCTCKR